MTENDFFTLTVQRGEEIWEYEIEKEPQESLGIVLEDKAVKECQNNCLFCFIDQLPGGMRDTLYIKDDDERLSFLRGNYVTLTNLSKEDIERICKYKIPVNISVHTTDETERKLLLRNKRAGNLLKRLRKLDENGIRMNAQIVLVPEINDKSLLKTLEDLIRFYPNLYSVSIVPVGLTKYRNNLYPLRTFSKDEAKTVIDEVTKFQERMLKKHKTRFAFLSDEFYLLAGEDIPQADYYEGFGQIENGVGMIRKFTDEFNDAFLKSKEKSPVPSLIVTGTAFYPYLKKLFQSFWPDIEVIGIENNFFGKNINVAGLLTGKDILENLKVLNLQDYKQVVFSANLFKAQSDLFLDDLSLRDLQKELNIKTVVAEDAVELIEAIWGEYV